MALKLNKLFVRVPGDVTVADISAVSVQEDNQKKLYFLENLHQIVNNGIAYGVDPNTVQSITDLQQLIGKSAKDQGENTIIERLVALEAIKVASADANYISIDTSTNSDGTTTPVIDLNIVGIGSGNAGLVDAVDAKGYIDDAANAAKSEVAEGKGIKVTSTTGANSQTIYTVDSSLLLEYVAPVTTTGSEANAQIRLTDNNGNSFGSIDVASIIGNGILQGSSYNQATGILTLTFAEADGTPGTVDIDLRDMLDLGDLMVKANSTDYLQISTVDSSTDVNQAQFEIKIADVENAADGSTGLVDAWDVKQYIASQTTDLAVTAEGDNYVDASVLDNDNKNVRVAANVQTLTGTKGTAGTYDATGTQTAAPSHGTLSGTANSLVDAADVATKVKDYVDGEVAIEAARSNAYTDAKVAALDAEVTSSDGDNVTVKVTEVDGIITAVNVTDTYATVDSSLGVTTNTGLVKGSDIEKVKTYVDNVAQDLSIGITGDNYITATRGDNKNYTITADVTTLTLTTGGNSDSTLAGTTDSLVDAADAASKVSDFVNARIGEEVAKLDATATASDTYFTMTVGEADGKLIDASTSATLTYGSMDGSTANNATGGIAKAEDVQDFVDTYNFWETYSASNNG